MKILFYNWAQFDDWKLRGGGVSVYLRNIISGLLKLEPSLEIFFLSSGKEYDLFRKDIHIEKTSNIFEKQGVKSFSVFNSPIKAPAHDMFSNLEQQFSNSKLKETIKKFLIEHGPFDVVHFHNLEGISLDIFSLKEDFSETKFIFTAHNYHCVCPQVELFQGRKKICKDFQNGAQCFNCLGYRPNLRSLLRYQRLGSFIERRKLEGRPLGDFLFSSATQLWNIYKSSRLIFQNFKTMITKTLKGAPKRNDRNILRLETIPTTKDTKFNYSPDFLVYKQWRDGNVELINKYIDKFISVSTLTHDKLTSFGISKNKSLILLNGIDKWNSKEEAEALCEKKLDKSRMLCVGYFGYPIPSKGLDLFLNAIEQLDVEAQKKISVLIASRLDPKTEKRLTELSPLFANIKIIRGYKREMIPELMSMINLGVVPSKGLETFCQVGAEMICQGTPVLVSDTTGIKELIRDERFVFPSGDEEELAKRINEIIQNPIALKEFWNSVTMPDNEIEHARKLLTIYSNK